LLEEDNGGFVCEINASYFADASVCERDQGIFCADVRGGSSSSESRSSSGESSSTNPPTISAFMVLNGFTESSFTDVHKSGFKQAVAITVNVTMLQVAIISVAVAPATNRRQLADGLMVNYAISGLSPGASAAAKSAIAAIEGDTTDFAATLRNELTSTTIPTDFGVVAYAVGIVISSSPTTSPTNSPTTAPTSSPTSAGGVRCNDGIVNSFETDVDCGGFLCSKCEDGLVCELDNDCFSGRCGNSKKCESIPTYSPTSSPTSAPTEPSLLRNLEKQAEGLRLIVTATCHAPTVDIITKGKSINVDAFDNLVIDKDDNETTAGVDGALLSAFDSLSSKLWKPPGNEEGGMSMSKVDLLEMASSMDLFGTFIFLVMLFFLHGQEQTEADWFNLETVECADYTVLVNTLPKHTNSKDLAKEIRKHFDEVLNMKAVKAKALKKRGDESEREVSVNAIHFGYDNHVVMNAELRRFKLMEKIEMAGHKLQCILVLEGAHRDHPEKEEMAKKGTKVGPKQVHKQRKAIARMKIKLAKLDALIIKQVQALDSDLTTDEVRSDGLCERLCEL
jgi:hypothetical protein